MASTEQVSSAILWTSVASALLGSFQFGYHLGVLNTCLDFVAADLAFTAATSGAVAVSAALVGASVGSLAAGQAADALGPGRALLLNNLFLILGSLLAFSTPYGFWGLLAGRLFSGVGAGAASLYVPRYITEIAPSKIRGTLSSQNQVFVTVGILAAFVVGWPYAQGSAAAVIIAGRVVPWWRIMFVLGLLPAILQMVGLSLSPESPVWLRWVRKPEAAHSAEQRLLGYRGESALSQQGGRQDAEQPLLQQEESVHQQEASTAQEDGEGWPALLHRRYRRIMVLAVGLPLLQQGSGINTVILYSSKVFALAGLTTPIVGSVITGAVQVVASIVSAALMDRAGRRPLLLWSHAGMGTCLAVLSLAFILPLASSSQGSTALGAVILFVLFYSLGSGPIPWVYLPEILPDPIKGRAAAACTCLNWVANLLIGLTFPLLLQLLHLSGVYLIFVVINALGVVFVWLLVVETKQQSLAEIQRLLQDS